jgi:subtilase family serine protease
VFGPVSLSVVASAGPDLVVKQVKNGSSASVGGSIEVNELVSNVGSAAAGASTTRFYLSVDPVKDPSDLLLTGSHPVPALASAASASGVSEQRLPGRMMPGKYYLIACADDLNAVAETFETNNCFTSKTGVTVK